MTIDDLLAQNPVVPVVVVDSAEEGEQVGRALVAGGIHSAEVTFRTGAAPAAIARMSTIKDLLVGAGTVTSVAQVDQALESGAQFIVSPGFSPAIVKRCLELEIPVLPACTDGSWIMAALELGLTTAKFFPAGVMGGIAALKAFAAPFPSFGFVPTGGVSADNLADYLALPSVRACGGSWMVASSLVHNGQWDEIAAKAAEATRIARTVRP